MDYPATLPEAVDRLLAMMTDDQKRQVRSTAPADLWRFHYSLGQYIDNEFGLCAGNDELMKSCLAARGQVWTPFGGAQPDDASEVIINALWERLWVGGER